VTGKLASAHLSPRGSRRVPCRRCSGLCLVDIAIYNATGWHSGPGFVGFRRNYLQELPADRFEPLHVHEQTDVGPVVAVCEAFWLHELLFEILDIALCAVLLVYTTYIGYSHTQRVIFGDSRLSRARPPKAGSGKRPVRV